MAELAIHKLGHLGNFATGPFGSSVSSKHFRDVGTPMVRGSNLSLEVGQRFLDRGFVFLDPSVTNQFARCLVRPGDLIFTCWGTIGQIGLVPSNGAYSEYLISNKQMKMTPDVELVDSLYLYYLLSSPLLLKTVQMQTIGSSVPGFNLGQLKELAVELPDLDKQIKLAKCLDTLDRLIQNNLRRIELLEETARLLYQEWFVNFRYPGSENVPLVESEVGSIPRGWELTRLDEACEFNDGKTIETDDRQCGPVPVYGANGIIGWTEQPIHPPCTVMGKIGSCGALHRSTAPCWVTHNSFCVTPGLFKFDSMVWSALTQIDFSRFVGGSANPYLPLNYFGHLKLPLPNTEVLEAFEELVGPIQIVQDRLTDTNEVLVEARDLLLPRLVSGDLDISDLDLGLEAVS